MTFSQKTSKMPKMLGEFMTALITGKDCDDQMSNSQTKFKHLVTQNIVYTFSNSRDKKPKRLLYPNIIKQLKNNMEIINPLSTNPIKWSNTLKQFVSILPTNCLSVSEHFLKLAFKGLILHTD